MFQNLNLVLILEIFKKDIDAVGLKYNTYVLHFALICDSETLLISHLVSSEKAENLCTHFPIQTLETLRKLFSPDPQKYQENWESF